MSFLVHDRLHRSEIDGELSDVSAARLLLELVPAHGHGIEPRAFDLTPERLLEDGHAVEAGALERCEERVFGKRPADALTPKLTVRAHWRRHFAVGDDVRDHGTAAVLQDPPDLAEYRRLVWRQVDDAVRRDDVGGRGIDRNLLEDAFPELDVVVSQRGRDLRLRVARDGE